jgi:hypothetical protein
MSKSEKKQFWVSEEIYKRVAAYGTADETMEVALKRVLDLVEEKRE